MGAQDLVAWGAFALLAISIVARLATRGFLARPHYLSNKILFGLSLLALGAALWRRDRSDVWSVCVSLAVVLAVLSQWLWTRRIGAADNGGDPE